MIRLSLLALFVQLARQAHAVSGDYSQTNLLLEPLVATAGIGAEFESNNWRLRNDACSEADSDRLKGHAVKGRVRDLFRLTVDSNGQGFLNAEYVIDGKRVKVGSGDAAKAGAAVAKDVIDWRPWDMVPPPQLEIENSPAGCNPWRISSPPPKTDPSKMRWEPQITTPMPLEVIYRFMVEQKADPKKQHRNILNGGDDLQPLIVVTKDYFHDSGIDSSKLTDDLLGFCSLVMTYAKNAKENENAEDSIKDATSLMTRTEFNTLFAQVKSKLPPKVNLLQLFESLACYTTENGKTVIDDDYCAETDDGPESTGLFSSLVYRNVKQNAKVKIAEWIHGIGVEQPFPDLLTQFDKTFDGSVGGYGAILEKLYGSEREAPLFEFRNLPFIPTTDFADFMGRADAEVQRLHKQYAQIPKLLDKANRDLEL